MARSNILNRKEGNFEPKEPYRPEAKERVEKTVVEKSTESQIGKRRKNIKVSEDMKKSIDAIKTIKGYSYDYEVIRMLIDSYIGNETESNKKKYNILKDL